VNFTIKQKRAKGRHHIQVSATPKTPESRALLQEFKKGLSKLEKKWKAIVRARERAAAKAKPKRKARRKAKK
jgi:hypothetical protein